MEINDLAFGYHAVLLTLLTCVQARLYKTQRQRVHPLHAFVVATLWILAGYTLVLCFLSHVPLLPHCSSTMQPDLSTTTSYDDSFTLIDFMGYVKAFISIVKYTPQAYLNYRRQSTVGWSITNILLDFTGGTLSFAQQVVVSINAGNTGPLFGNVPKLLLALESIAFDILFMLQHFVLYRGNGVKEGEEPLVESDGEGGAETDEGEGKREGEGEEDGGQVEGAVRPHQRSSKAAQKAKPGRRERQKRPLRLLGEDGGAEEGEGGLQADGYPQYRPPEVIDDDADDPYEPGFSAHAAGRINNGAGLSSFGGRGVSPSRGLGGGAAVSGRGGSPRLAIIDRYGDSGVPGGRR